MSSITVTKSSDLELYQIRGKNFEGWADIVLIIRDKTVSVMIASDYGSFSYYWGACGFDPKQFLISLNWDYAMKNLSDYKNYISDPEANDRKVKRLIIEARRNGSLNNLTARDAWEELTELDSCRNYDLYINELVSSEYFEEVFGEYEHLPDEKTRCPCCVEFWEKCWIPFTNQLKQELSLEGEK